MLRLSVLLVLISIVAAPSLAQPVASDGFIYGTLTLQNGDQHTGFLRWEDEEAYWDDLFHSRQDDLPWIRYADLKDLHREKEKRYFETHGMIDRIHYALNNKNPDEKIARLFIARFGDIAAINIDADENVTVMLNDGSSHEVRGYSNDVSTDIIVYPANGKQDNGEEEVIEWDDLAEIRFVQAPTETVPYAERLYGRVATSRGEFEGFIQWDLSECTTTDVLDSNEEDLAMGEIKAITRQPGGNVMVDLHDGRQLSLTGSNDVDDGNRGVVVETADMGRITIGWQRFKKVDFVTGQGSGKGRDSYTGNADLQGTVTSTNDAQLTGRLVYDLNAARQHDLFNGTHENIDYDIPFGLIQSVTPLEEDGCQVVLRNGQSLELNNDQDTGKDSTGVLIFAADGQTAERVAWSKLREVRFAP